MSFACASAKKKSKWQSLLEALEDLRRRKCADTGCCQLQGEGKLVEAVADPADIAVGFEVRSHRSGARQEEADALLLHEGRDRVLVLGREAERLPARGQQLQVWTGCEQLAETGRSLDHLLEVVEDEEHSPVADVLRGIALRADRGGDRRKNELGISNRLQPDPPDAVLVFVDELGRGLDGDARLPGTARPGQRHEE